MCQTYTVDVIDKYIECNDVCKATNDAPEIKLKMQTIRLRVGSANELLHLFIRTKQS